MKKIFLIIFAYFALCFPLLQAKEYFVDGQNPVANDNNIGTIDLPLKTIDGARSLVRIYILSHLPLSENIIIWIRGGTYQLLDTIYFNSPDSGSAQFPVVYQGYQNEKVIISGKKTLAPGSFQTVLASDPHWGQIKAAAQGVLVSTNLNSVGITEYGTMANDNSTYMQLFINDQRQDMARWPDVDEQRSPAVLNSAGGFDLVGVTTPAVAGRFIANGTSDGITAFKREALLGGVQYYLYRYFWNYLGHDYRAWFLTTQSAGYPAANAPFWYVYSELPNTLNPGTFTTGTLRPGPNLISESTIENGFIGFQKADTDDSFYFLSDRVLTWGSANDLMVHGFMNWLWSDSLTKVASINMGTRKVVLNQIPTYGVDDGHNGRLFVFNLIEEITKPGEWYLDKVTGKLYLWPTTNFNSSKIAVSVLNKTMIQTTNTNYVTFKNISFDGGRNNTIDLSVGVGLNFDSCEFLNTGLDGIGFSNCLKSSVQNSTIMGAGKNGIWTYNWNLRTNLIDSELLFQNNDISKVGQWRYAYMCPFNMYYSVGVSILNNDIHDLPHTAILFSGNENKIYRNKIFDVCKKTSDAGAIYCGRDWAYRGNIIKNNFIYNITSEVGADVHGIYFDDAVAGNSAIGNILYKIKGFGVEHGGGRDTTVKGNIFYQCEAAYSIDDRGRQFINNIPNDTWNFFDRMTNTQVDYKAEPWKSKYPLLYAIPNDWATVSNPANKWFEPGGSIVTANLGFQNTKFLNEYNYISPGTSVTPELQEYSNNVENTDPLFKDKDLLDFELLPSSPAFAIPGFVNIPFHKIGLFKNTTSVISASSGAGGSISPAGSVIVKYGLNQIFTMTPIDGYEVESVLVDGTNVGAVLTYTFTSVVIEHTISVTYKIKSYTITATTSANGSIAPVGITIVTHGSAQAYTITPAMGYVVVDVLVDGVSAGALSAYTFTNVIEDHTIAVSFALKTYTLTSSAGGNGTITPLDVQVVAENSNMSYTITPDAGYQIESLKIDGVAVAIASTYTFSNILANHQIAVTFVVIPTFSITATASSGGIISPSGIIKITTGGSQSFTFTANTGFSIDDVLVDGVSQGKVSSFKFENVLVDHIVSVQFKTSEITFDIVSSIEGGGTISPLGTTSVLKNANQIYVITASDGFEVQSVLIDEVSVGKLSSYTFTNVIASHTIKAVLVPSIKKFTISASALANGLISPNGNSSITEGDDASFIFVADSNYQVLDVVVDGVSQGALLSYEFENVSADHSIQASFALITKDSKKELLSFSFKDLKSKVQGIINDDKVSIVVPTGTDLSALVANFTFIGVKVLVNGVDLISGVSKIDYREPVEVIVEANDGSKKKYQVTVFEAGEVTSGLVGFEHSSYSVSESSGKAKVTINRFGGSSGIVKVKYETMQNTATETSDYTKTSGELVWEDGDSANKTIEISLVSDEVEESDETFSVKILSIDGATEGSFQNTEVVIRNLSGTEKTGGSAGGCNYAPQMPWQDQLGNILLVIGFGLMILLRRRNA